jgi:hypothetical protein
MQNNTSQINISLQKRRDATQSNEVTAKNATSPEIHVKTSLSLYKGMKHIYLFFVTFCLLINGCTGTPGETTPFFVIAGVTSSTGSSLLVLQDRVADNTSVDEPRFTRFTSQPLPAPAVAFESVDEAGLREELIILSRSQTTAGGVTTVSAFLNFFNTRGLTPDDETTFRASRGQLDLRSLTYPFPLTDLCPVDLETTRDGTYAVIFNSPRVCYPGRLETDNTIVILFTPRDAAASVVTSLRFNNFTNPLPTGMFLDQSSDALYYLRRFVSTPTLLRVERGQYTSSSFDESNTNNVQTIASDVLVRTEDFRDITKVGGNLAILGANNYVLAPLSVTTGFRANQTTTLGVRFQEPRSFVTDVTATSLLIFDDNQRLVYHADPTTTTNTTTDTEGVVSTFNTSEDYLYLADTGRMDIIDTRPFEESNTNLDALFSEETCNTSQAADGLCALTNPSALSWAQGILLPESQ